MKKKTSVSIYRKILAKLKARAKEQDRCVSYVLEKFMEAMVIEAPGKRKRIGRPFRPPLKVVTYEPARTLGILSRCPYWLDAPDAFLGRFPARERPFSKRLF